jgi:class 3 adenylate cyclase/putative methionine-R-sulfoxide reductase with GAF domain
MEETRPTPPSSTSTLEEKLERKKKELEILAAVFTHLRSSQDLETILQNILQQLDLYFGFKHSMILLTGGRNTLRVFASQGYPDPGIGAKIEIGKGIIGTAALRKKIIRIGNLLMTMKWMLAGEVVQHIEDEIVIKLPGLKKPASQVAIPLLVRDDLIGVLSVESEEINMFQPEDEHVISLIASQAAIAIHTARMHQAELERFREIEAINARLSELTNKQQQTLDLFVKFVPETVVKKALREKPDDMFEGEQQNVALLFCDIRDFTPMAEKLQPKQVVGLLNTFYSGMNQVIKAHGGTIIQYTGDEIFVIFGAPVPMARAAEKAVCCGVHMVNQRESINAALQSYLNVSINIGIGINYGPVVAGNLGCEDKLAYSVTGDSVNTAKRIESLSKNKYNSILISESVHALTSHLLVTEAWEPIEVKGKGERIRVYEVTGLKGDHAEHT